MIHHSIWNAGLDVKCIRVHQIPSIVKHGEKMKVSVDNNRIQEHGGMIRSSMDNRIQEHGEMIQVSMDNNRIQEITAIQGAVCIIIYDRQKLDSNI